LAEEARLVADHGAGAALALQAVAHGDAHRLAFDGERELAAAAGGAAGGHGLAPRTIDAAATVAAMRGGAPRVMGRRHGVRPAGACPPLSPPLRLLVGGLFVVCPYWGGALFPRALVQGSGLG